MMVYPSVSWRTKLVLLIGLWMLLLAADASAQPFRFYNADSVEKVHSNSRNVISSGATPPFFILVQVGDGVLFPHTIDTGYLIKVTYANETHASPIEEMLINRVNGDTLFVIQRAPVVGKNLTPHTWQTGADISIVFGGGYLKQIQDALNAVVPSVSGQSGKILSNNGSHTTWIAVPSVSDTGTVTSVGLNASALGFTVSGSPVASAGTITMSGTLGVAHGGTGLTGVSLGSLLYATGTNTLTATALGTGLSYSSGAINVSLSPFTTSNLVEGSNLYWTQGRFNTAFSAKTTTDLTEGANLYFTNARADARIAAQAGFPNGLAQLDVNGKLPLTQMNTVDISHGGTGQTSAFSALVALAPDTTNMALKYMRYDPNHVPKIYWDTAGHGSGGGVTSVDVSGGSTGLTTSGGPITASGTITIAGTLHAANGGTGQTGYTTGDLLYASGSTALSKLGIGTTNQRLTVSGGLPTWATYTDTGTVASVGLSMPTGFSVSGPVTSSGTLAVTFSSESQNAVLASPDGSSGTPSFRALVAGDIPSLDASKITTGTLAVARGGTNIGSYTTGDVIYASGATTLSKLAVGTSTQVIGGGTTPAYVQNGATIAMTAGTPSAFSITGNTNNYSIPLTQTWIRLQNTSGGEVDLTGIDASTSPAGRLLYLTNIGSQAIVIKNQSTASLAANRFQIHDGGNIILLQYGVASFYYDATSQVWQEASGNN